MAQWNALSEDPSVAPRTPTGYSQLQGIQHLLATMSPVHMWHTHSFKTYKVIYLSIYLLIRQFPSGILEISGQWENLLVLIAEVIFNFLQEV